MKDYNDKQSYNPYKETPFSAMLISQRSISMSSISDIPKSKLSKPISTNEKLMNLSELSKGIAKINTNMYIDISKIKILNKREVSLYVIATEKFSSFYIGPCENIIVNIEEIVAVEVLNFSIFTNKINIFLLSFCNTYTSSKRYIYTEADIVAVSDLHLYYDDEASKYILINKKTYENLLIIEKINDVQQLFDKEVTVEDLIKRIKDE